MTPLTCSTPGGRDRAEDALDRPALPYRRASRRALASVRAVPRARQGSRPGLDRAPDRHRAALAGAFRRRPDDHRAQPCKRAGVHLHASPALFEHSPWVAQARATARRPFRDWRGATRRAMMAIRSARRLRRRPAGPYPRTPRSCRKGGDRRDADRVERRGTGLGAGLDAPDAGRSSSAFHRAERRLPRKVSASRSSSARG